MTKVPVTSAKTDYETSKFTKTQVNTIPTVKDKEVVVTKPYTKDVLITTSKCDAYPTKY